MKPGRNCFKRALAHGGPLWALSDTCETLDQFCTRLQAGRFPPKTCLKRSESHLGILHKSILPGRLDPERDSQYRMFKHPGLRCWTKVGFVAGAVMNDAEFWKNSRCFSVAPQVLTILTSCSNLECICTFSFYTWGFFSGLGSSKLFGGGLVYGMVIVVTMSEYSNRQSC